MRLGIDSFSVRSQGWDAYQIMDYASALGLDNVHFSEREHLGGLDPDELQRVRAYAAERDLTLEIGMRSFNRLAESFVPSYGTGEEQLADMIEAATVVGSPIVRCFVGMASDRLRVPPANLIAETVRTLTAVAPRAEAAGITIAVENHGMGDLLAPELKDVIEAVDSSHVGVCFDSGNPVYAGEDPAYAAELLAPYTVSTHLRDTKVWLAPEGAFVQWAPCGRGTVDLKRIVQIILAASPETPIDLEVITGGGPALIDYRNPESRQWAMFPEMTAKSFARFLVLAEAGEPGPIDQIVPVPGQDLAEALKTQQREHFEESVTWSRQHLGGQAQF